MFKWRLHLKLPKTFKKIKIPHLLKTIVDPAILDNCDNDVKQAASECYDDETDNAISYKRVDTIVFVVLFCVALISTSILFVFLSQRRT